MRVSVIIPALDEEQAIGRVISEIPRDLVHDIIVVDNGSRDATASAAEAAGAQVVVEPRRGYGSACLAGIRALNNPDVVVFLDGDNSDYPEDLPLLLEPIESDRADLVIGSRTLGQSEPRALTPQQRFGNWLACLLLRLLYRRRFTDLGPFRAIRYSSLIGLEMADLDFGWTIEMQIKAIKQGLRVTEVPVRYRRRIGKSKISGTVKGSLLAGCKIIWTILRYAL